MEIRIASVSSRIKKSACTAWVNKSAQRLKKSCSLNIEATILKSVLFYSQYVKLGLVVYLALIGHSFPSKREIFCKLPLSKTCKNRYPMGMCEEFRCMWNIEARISLLAALTIGDCASCRSSEEMNRGQYWRVFYFFSVLKVWQF